MRNLLLHGFAGHAPSPERFLMSTLFPLRFQPEPASILEPQKKCFETAVSRDLSDTFLPGLHAS